MFEQKYNKWNINKYLYIHIHIYNQLNHTIIFIHYYYIYLITYIYQILLLLYLNIKHKILWIPFIDFAIWIYLALTLLSHKCNFEAFRASLLKYFVSLCMYVHVYIYIYVRISSRQSPNFSPSNTRRKLFWHNVS